MDGKTCSEQESRGGANGTVVPGNVIVARHLTFLAQVCVLLGRDDICALLHGVCKHAYTLQYYR